MSVTAVTLGFVCSCTLEFEALRYNALILLSTYTWQLLLEEFHLRLANAFSEILEVMEDSLLKSVKSKPQPPKETCRHI